MKALGDSKSDIIYTFQPKMLHISSLLGNCDAKERAIECYKQGINELQNGIEVECNGEGVLKY